MAIALHQHFRFSLMSDADHQFYQFASESTREKIKTKMIGMVKALLNEEDLRATSSDETVEAAKQDDFFCLNNQRTEIRAYLNT